MLEAYVAAGFPDPAAFWSLTPRLYLALMKGAGQRLEREHKDRAWQVWHIAALSRVDALPSFDEFLGAGPVEPQSPETLQAMCELLARSWGAEEI
ncbi:hypothetical protein [uncultured Pseudophaeobacter sp.]|jgi:hypothetical protein|uniref:hypothetical protein n=1 Tax=uncultured Pseudophaeobacter sp. TaxID=1759421 RepID=UPI0025DFB66C|nr:hypothetical protein [uncultured Pseudophaeobacter sp.]